MAIVTLDQVHRRLCERLRMLEEEYDLRTRGIDECEQKIERLSEEAQTQTEMNVAILEIIDAIKKQIREVLKRKEASCKSDT